jgi:hypothetical protein
MLKAICIYSVAAVTPLDFLIVDYIPKAKPPDTSSYDQMVKFLSSEGRAQTICKVFDDFNAPMLPDISLC